VTARAEALSDGVFAIAMTLLVLEIRVPAGETGLAAALVQQWAAIAAFAVSFLYLGVYWLNHFIASRVTRVDGPFLALNLVFLMSISFVPFPTVVLAVLLYTAVYPPLAVPFYGVAMLLPALAGSANWTYALRAGRPRPEAMSLARGRELERLYWAGPAIYAVAIVVALVATPIALAFYVLAPILYLIVGARSRELADG